MKNIIIFLFIIIFIHPFIFSSNIIVGADQGYPPYEYKQGHSITGFNVELMREIAKVERLDIEIVAGPWAEIREAFENHEIDVLTGFYYYPSRAEYTTFTHPHGYIIYSIFTLSDSTIKSKTDLEGKTILVQEGDVMVDYIEREKIEAVVLVYESPELVLAALSDGIGDCALIGQKQGQYLIQEKNFKGIHFINEPLLTIPYCFAVQKDNHALELKLNEGLRKLHLSGRYSEIYNQWFGSSGNRLLSLIISILIITGAIVLVFLILFYIWNMKLKEQVAKKTQTIITANRIIEKNNANLTIQNRKLAINEKELLNVNKLYQSLFNAMRIIVLSKDEEQMNHQLFQMLTEKFQLALFLMVSIKKDPLGRIQCHVQESYSQILASKNQFEDFVLHDEGLLQKQKHFRQDEWGDFAQRFCCENVIKSLQIKEMVSLPVQIHDETKLWCFFAQEVDHFTPEILHHLKQLSEDYAFAVSLYRTRQEIINANLETKSAIKLKNEFLANISHELRTPLNGMMGMITLLNKTQTDPEQQDYIDMLSLSSQQLLTIINQLLDYSVLDNGSLRLEKTPVMIRTFVEDTLLPMRQTAVAKELDFTYSVDSKVPETVWMDENQIRLALMNLVSNGIKYTKKGCVSVVFDSVMVREDNYLRVTIADTGIGIPFSKLNDIFSSFYQIDGSYSREYPGTGLGLSIAKKSIEMHKGWIEVDSELGQGSTFRFFIPLK